MLKPSCLVVTIISNLQITSIRGLILAANISVSVESTYHSRLQSAVCLGARVNADIRSGTGDAARSGPEHHGPDTQP
jgi:hypothetical protein